MKEPLTCELAARAACGPHLVSAGNLAAGALRVSARTSALVLAAGLAVAAVYMLGCLVWPYGPCLACRANPRRNPGSTARRHGRCKICRGTGERLRAGTRLWLAVTSGRLPKGVVRR